MMVTFISECEKKALKRTRKVLDAFADRIGSNTWQTVITQEGLLAVKKALRKTASKSTAVSCHWIRSRSRTELVWIVGRRDRFNHIGLVATNYTRRNILLSEIENNWQFLPLIKSLVVLSALLHDWGKASALFQGELKGEIRIKGDPIRHEWVSCLLLNVFISTHGGKDDKAWLETLASGDINEDTLKTHVKNNALQPLENLPPIAKLVAWLIVSHHRLPLNMDENYLSAVKAEEALTIDSILERITQQWGYENRYDETEYQANLSQCFTFKDGLLSQSSPWLKQVKKWAGRLLACESQALQVLDNNSYRLILLYSRLCLMLGDHYYSSLDADKAWKSNNSLYANTDRKTKGLKQQLDEHLCGVAKHGLNNAHQLPAFETLLPKAKDLQALKEASPGDYRWQDKAVNAIKKWKLENETCQAGFFVNMASTGCGKTFANAKIMRALSDDGDSLRFILALGLRTLTLQTGDEYRSRVKLDNSELAVLIGSKAIMSLHQQKAADEQKNSFENSGSLSEEPLLDEDIDFDCVINEDPLATVLKTDKEKKFLYAPVLACTIDHLMGATETKRGGRYILPTLRLMSSDLVIDEIDDFSGDDLIAIGRLIHLAGMLGRKVMISSATIPPDFAEGYFNTYRYGWQLYCKTRNVNPTIACAWIDENDTQISNSTATELGSAIKHYQEQHAQFIQTRSAYLLKQTIKRKADISDCQHIVNVSDTEQNPYDEDLIHNKQQAYFKTIFESACRKHYQHHIVDEQTTLNLSFGVIRMANISPCVALTRYLLITPCPDDIEIRVMAYHSQQVLLLRHLQEEHLDKVLKRKGPEDAPPKALSNTIIRTHLNQIHQQKPHIKHVLFIVIATPVEEVGRDHDFDWAVIEPSSLRSIIQLAGRVRRHRNTATPSANISLMQYNWKGIKHHRKPEKKVFNNPGPEEKIRLEKHNLDSLVDEQALALRVDAIPRITKADELQPTKKLADLEHHAIKELLANYSTASGPASLRGYLREAWFLTALPQQCKPFRAGQATTKLFLTYQPNNENFTFCEKDDDGELIPREKTYCLHKVNLTEAESERLWLARDYAHAISAQAEKEGTSLRAASIRYGEIVFIFYENTDYDYNDQFGLYKKEGADE